MNRWPIKTLIELCDVRIGRTPRRDRTAYWGGDAIWVTIRELNGSEIRDSKEKISDIAVQECMTAIVPSGTLLFSFKLSIGKIAVAGVPLYTNEAIAALIIRDSKLLSRDFLKYALMSQLHDTGANDAVLGKVLNKEMVCQIPIPVPPLSEQERIVRKLGEADQLRQLRAEADRRTADLIPAMFHEMFGNLAAGKNRFPILRLEDICVTPAGIKAGPFGSSLKKECYTIEGPRVYGQEQIIAGDFTIGDYHISQSKYDEMKAYAVLPWDVLISLVGTFGKIAIVPENSEPGIINPRLIRLRVNQDNILPVFLKRYLEMKDTQDYLQSLARGQTMGVLNATLLRELTVPVPPLEQQRIFVSHVAEIQDFQADQAESKLQVDNLFQSLLHRAFQGEL